MDKTARALESLSATDRELQDNQTLTKAFVKALAQRRAALRESIPEALLAAYDALGRMGRRPVIVPLRKSHCGGCFLRLPPQLESAVRHRQSLRTCPHCHRLLYSPASPQTENAGDARPILKRPPAKALPSERLSRPTSRRSARERRPRAAGSAQQRV